ncbi:uncharacterized protein ACA1_290310 [Acanthamoeba castellanii str. Neff]|uniref:PBP domain-containing protein n=1 Tax=Acanthamoeba castellanii (strain ATCC 30010 / Neff) TaxID=1257118 RepID=L8HJ71_ACACF|nr:uncharacterized protein ACA1_290310 [Acanthamoeba castellanii str. Neff]ELR25267.1 hypothetical protein ACA1_290310 [Acanthamoeba castellanii str. Neff]
MTKNISQITRWNDTAIAGLNPNITARLPDADILTSFRNDSAVSSTTVFKRALNVFSNGTFARNGSLAGLPPAANGFSFGYATDAERINYVKVSLRHHSHDNSLTYLNSYEATNASLSYAMMVNAAGYTVTATQAAVQAAMTAYRPFIDNGDLTVDILNANGSASWPLSYISFALIPQNITTPDCSNIQELLLFLSWTQLNAKASAVASSLGDTALINAYRRRLIDTMGTIYCNGQKAFKTAVLLGMGPPYTIYYTWVANYPSTAFKVQYTSAVSQTAITEMAAGDIDYAAISTELTAAQKQLMPDAEGVPTIGYGILPVYNISELIGYDPVIMDWQAISDIFLNKISMWNDPYLVGLNPHLAGLLPNKPITIRPTRRR